MTIYDTVSKVLESYGDDILLDYSRFFSILSDLIPQSKEIKVIKRMGESGILMELYKLRNTNRSHAFSKIVTMLSEEGFSEEWITIALESFGYEYLNTSSVSATNISTYTHVKELNGELIETAYGNLLYITDSNVGKNVFSGRTDFRIAVLGNGVKCVKRNAFKNCNELEYLYVSNTVRSYASGAFANCNRLKYILEQKPNTKLNNIIVDKDAFCGCSVSIPDGSRLFHRESAVIQDCNMYKSWNGWDVDRYVINTIFDILKRYA